MKVLIIEDDQFHASYLQDTIAEALPEVTETRHASDGIAGQSEARATQARAIVMDLQMGRQNGVETARAIWAERPDTRILFWSNYADEAYLRGIAGIVPEDCPYGYVMKTASNDWLKIALRAVFVEGQIMVDREIHRLQHRRKREVTRPTESEYAVLLDLAIGLPDKMIAARRHMSLRTVQNRLLSLYDKLGLEDEQAERFNRRVRAVNRALVTRVINLEALEAAERDFRAWSQGRGDR